MNKFLLSFLSYCLVILTSQSAMANPEIMELLSVRSGQAKIIPIDPMSTNQVEIANILLDPELNSKAGMTVVFESINGSRYRNTSLSPEIDISIANITSSSSTIKPNVSFYFRGLRVKNLKIDQGNNKLNSIGTVNLEFQNGSTIQNADLSGGNYGLLSFKVGRVLDESNSSVGDFDINIGSFEQMQFWGDDLYPAVSMKISSDTATQAPYAGTSLIKLNFLTLLNTQVILQDTANSGIANQFEQDLSPCRSDTSTTKVSIEQSRIGDPDNYYSSHPSDKGLAIKFPVDKCLSFDLLSINGEGQIEVSAGGVNHFTMHDVGSEGSLGLGVEVNTRQIDNVRIAASSLSNFTISTYNTETDKKPEVHTWGSFNVRDETNLPSGVFDGLDDLLHEHSQKSMKAVSGVRAFLTSTAWKSYVSETGEPAYARSLHSVLYSDSSRIHGPVIAGLLDWVTGFGIKLRKPLFLAGGLVVVSLFSTLLFPGPKRSKLVTYARAFFGFSTTDTQHDKRVVSLSKLVRWVLLAQFTLFSLFLQNAILIG